MKSVVSGEITIGEIVADDLIFGLQQSLKGMGSISVVAARFRLPKSANPRGSSLRR